MYLLFPLIGVIASWIALDHVGPPLVQGDWNPASICLWLVMVAFGVRLLAACFGIYPKPEQNPHGQ